MNKGKICGRKLRNFKSIQRCIGPTCEAKYLQDFYEKSQITIEEIIKKENFINGKYEKY